MIKGTVIKSTGSWYSVKTVTGEILDCKIKGTFRIKGIKNTNPIAVGDYVSVEISNLKSADTETGIHTTPKNNNNGKQVGLITAIDERKNYIIRKAPNLSKQSQIIAANIDQGFLIVTVKYPVTTTTFIDRFLASAEAYRIPCNIIFNKIDLYDRKQMLQLESLVGIYENIGYKCLKTSAKDNTGLDILKEWMHGKTSVFSGHSGTGKSTLINKIESSLNLKTQEISDYHEMGKHTTTFAEMFQLSFGGYIIDTPGIKGFGMLDMQKEEISHYFPEFFKRLDKCQYYNCTHTHEPGCEVKKAVEAGEIAQSRYISYLGLLSGDEKYRS